MTEKEAKTASKFLSLVLRHAPERAGIALDPEGWADVEELLDGLRAAGRPLLRPELEELVAASDKQRFAFSADGRKIRANQGHSVAVDLGLAPQAPPETLYHGTIAANLPGIREKGLLKGARQHAHLSADEESARRVGARRGKPVILRIRARDMAHTGRAFYLSENGVWLADTVPPAFIDFPA